MDLSNFDKWAIRQLLGKKRGEAALAYLALLDASKIDAILKLLDGLKKKNWLTIAAALVELGVKLPSNLA